MIIVVIIIIRIRIFENPPGKNWGNFILWSRSGALPFCKSINYFLYFLKPYISFYEDVRPFYRIPPTDVNSSVVQTIFLFIVLKRFGLGYISSSSGYFQNSNILRCERKLWKYKWKIHSLHNKPIRFKSIFVFDCNIIKILTVEILIYSTVLFRYSQFREGNNQKKPEVIYSELIKYLVFAILSSLNYTSSGFLYFLKMLNIVKSVKMSSICWTLDSFSERNKSCKLQNEISLDLRSC